MVIRIRCLHIPVFMTKVVFAFRYFRCGKSVKTELNKRDTLYYLIKSNRACKNIIKIAPKTQTLSKVNTLVFFAFFCANSFVVIFVFIPALAATNKKNAETRAKKNQENGQEIKPGRISNSLLFRWVSEIVCIIIDLEPRVRQKKRIDYSNSM